jgi:hypothetical protein
VPEARKREPVRRALTGPVDTSCPATILQMQPHATIHLDRESAAGLGPRPEVSGPAAGTLRRSEPGPERPGPQGRERE